MLERNLTYLAVPYSHDDESIRKARFERVSKVGAWLMLHGHIVYSPISHCHPMARYDLPGGWQFWKHYDVAFMEYSRLFVILPLEGWRSSVGLGAERQEAKHLDLPIMYVQGNLDTCNHDKLSLSWKPPEVDWTGFYEQKK